MLIEYCDKCGYKIEENDFQVGKVVRIGDRVICIKCAPPESQVDSPEPKLRKISKRAPGSSGRQVVPPAATQNDSSGSRFSGPVLFLCGALILMGSAFYIVERGRTDDGRLPPETATPSEPAPTDAETTGAKENPRFSMLLQKRSPEESKAESEYDAILKMSDKTRRFETLTQFLANTPPDWDVSARARVTFHTLKASAGMPGAGKPAELIAHYKFNEGKGGTATDATLARNHGRIGNKMAWSTTEKGGLHFKNDADHVVLPNVAELDSLQENDYSISAWFKPDSDPPEETDPQHCGYAIVAKPGKHAGLTYYHGGYFTMDHWLAGGNRVHTSSDRAFPPNKFYHVVGVVNRTAGETRVYVDGRLAGIRTWTPNAATRSYGKSAWRIGIAIVGKVEWSWPAKGIIRDVRLYRGVLSDAEIKTLSEK
jgi:hypothetical protein